MTLVKWKILVLIEQLKKVTLVAQELGLKQPTVTFHMKSMEEEWQLPLFKVKTGRVLLTDAGRSLHRYALRILTLHEEAAQEMKLQSDNYKRLTLLTQTPSRSSAVLLCALALQNTGFGLQLITPEQVSASSGVDLQVLERQDDSSEQNPLLSYGELQLAVSSRSEYVSLSATLSAGLPWIAPPEGSMLRSIILAWAAERKIELSEVYSMPDTDSAASLVAEGIGIAFLPVFPKNYPAKDGQIRLLRLPNAPYYPLELQLGSHLSPEITEILQSRFQETLPL